MLHISIYPTSASLSTRPPLCSPILFISAHPTASVYPTPLSRLTHSPSFTYLPTRTPHLFILLVYLRSPVLHTSAHPASTSLRTHSPHLCLHIFHIFAHSTSASLPIPLSYLCSPDLHISAYPSSTSLLTQPQHLSTQPAHLFTHQNRCLTALYSSAHPTSTFVLT